MRIAYFEPLSRAWDRTRVLLWQPFDLANWLLLAFIAWVAGLTTDTGSAIAWQDHEGTMSRNPVRDLDQAFDQFAAGAVWIPLVLLAIMVGIAVAVLLLWVTSRFKFIYLDGVVSGRAEVVEPWKRREVLGNSLFLWRLCFGAACVLGALLVMLVFFAPAAGFSINDALAGLSVAAGILGTLGLVVFGITMGYIGLFTESFVVPIMYRYDMKVLDAWQALMPWLRARPFHFVVYGLFVLMLFTVFAVFYSIFCLLTCCMAAIPYLGTVLLLPVWVTYRLLSLEFLAQFHPDFDLFTPLPEEDEGAGIPE